MCRLFVALVAYFVIGMVIMKVKFQATGSDIIPNKSFWFGLPLLVKVMKEDVTSMMCCCSTFFFTGWCYIHLWPLYFLY